MSSLLRWLPTAWAFLLAGLLLGPALGPGYVLTYDMVWVPDLALRDDFLGLGSALPRAVPSDAVVAVLDEVVPGMLLQKLVLVGSLVAAGAGGAALVAGLSAPGPLPGGLADGVEPVRGRATGTGSLAGARRVRRAALAGPRRAAAPDGRPAARRAVVAAAAGQPERERRARVGASSCSPSG